MLLELTTLTSPSSSDEAPSELVSRSLTVKRCHSSFDGFEEESRDI